MERVTRSVVREGLVLGSIEKEIDVGEYVEVSKVNGVWVGSEDELSERLGVCVDDCITKVEDDMGSWVE